MDRPLRTVLGCACLASALAAAGCGGGARQPALYDQPQPPPTFQTPAERNAQAQAAQAPPPAEMQRLLARLDSLEFDNKQLKQQLSDQYMQAVRERQAQRAAHANGGAAGAGATHPDNDIPANGPPNVAGANAGRGIDDLDRAELMQALINKIVEGQDPARTKALMVAAIGVADQREKLDHDLLDQLDPRSREQVARFHQMVAVAFDELAGDTKRTLTRREMIEQIDKVFGAQPLQIQALELCRRVDSYGVYEPFVSNRFLAGRKNRVLVYVELENFHHEPAEDGRFKVTLEQQVELYDAAGETPVWRQGPVTLEDVSRNKRRDFFIVHPIDLPADLTAGGYRLKVRVADKHTGSICEQTMHDIKIVADRAMVGGER